MKLDGSFELKTLAGQSIVVPGKLKNVDFTNLLTLNETAAVVWERMTQGEFEVDDLVKALTDAYEVDEAQARELCLRRTRHRGDSCTDTPACLPETKDR